MRSRALIAAALVAGSLVISNPADAQALQSISVTSSCDPGTGDRVFTVTVTNNDTRDYDTSGQLTSFDTADELVDDQDFALDPSTIPPLGTATATVSSPGSAVRYNIAVTLTRPEEEPVILLVEEYFQDGCATAATTTTSAPRSTTTTSTTAQPGVVTVQQRFTG